MVAHNSLILRLESALVRSPGDNEHRKIERSPTGAQVRFLNTGGIFYTARILYFWLIPSSGSLSKTLTNHSLPLLVW